MSHGIAEHKYKFLNVQVSKSIIQIMIKRNVFKQKYQLKKKRQEGMLKSMLRSTIDL